MINHVKLPNIPPISNTSRSDFLHIVDNFCYYKTVENSQTVLYGGYINNRWETKFKINAPVGRFRILDDQIYFLNNYLLQEDSITVVNNSGKLFTFTCSDIRILNGFFYQLKKQTDSLYYLSISDIGHNISDLRNTNKISINSKSIKLLDILSDGTCVCESGYGDKTILIVNITKNIIYTLDQSIPSYGNLYIDTAENTIWSWDQLSEKIWKHKKDSSVNVGNLKSGRGTTLLCVADQKLFFVDIPF